VRVQRVEEDPRAIVRVAASHRQAENGMLSQSASAGFTRPLSAMHRADPQWRIHDDRCDR